MPVVSDQDGPVVLADEPSVNEVLLAACNLSGRRIEHDSRPARAHGTPARDLSEDESRTSVGARNLDRAPDLLAGVQVIGTGCGLGDREDAWRQVGEHGDGSVTAAGESEPGAR